MKIFISYSFRPENAWIEQFVIPLVECFGHEAVTGRILDAGPLEEEVKRKIRSCRRVLCFVTRAAPRRDETGAIVSYEPPDWVRDELMMARGANRDAIEFRESGVLYGGASAFHAQPDFEHTNLPKLLIDIAQRLKEWPVGPLQLRLEVPDLLRPEIERAVIQKTLQARCAISDDDGTIQHNETLPVRMQDARLIVPFWVKPTPSQTIEIEITLGSQRLVAQGISPTVREARLAVV